MKNYKEQFRGKKITVMGLGILGRGLGYTKFLAECGADLIVTDLKTKRELATSVKALSKYEKPAKGRAGIQFVLGEHRLEDFRDRDMIIKAAGVPMKSPYISEAEDHHIPIEMDVSLFAKCAPEVMIIGVTGTRGKSMTTSLIYEILKAEEKFLKRKACPPSRKFGSRRVYIGGNIRGVATLPLLKKAKAGDILVCELDSWQLQGFGDAKISPHISVFTTFMPDHMNYYKDSMKDYFDDKANIFKYQKKGDILVIRPEMKKLIPKNIVGKLVMINRKNVADWKFNVPGEHHQENLACAVEVAKQFKIPISKIRKSVADFKDLEGRLQLLKTYKGIKIYNDNNATTPAATVAGIQALKAVGRKNIVLICGGADKKLPLADFVKAVNKYCKAIVFIPGSGTNTLLKNYKITAVNKTGKELKDIIPKAIKYADKGDVILFSPAFASFGMFNNEYERNDLFMKIIKKLK